MIYTHAAAVLVGLAIGFGGAWKVQAWRWDSAVLAAQQKQQAAARAQIRQIDKASEGYEADRAGTKTEFTTITKEVERVIEKPVYRNVCFDDDGLRQLERAARATGYPGEPASGVPASGAAK